MENCIGVMKTRMMRYKPMIYSPYLAAGTGLLEGKIYKVETLSCTALDIILGTLCTEHGHAAD